MTAPPATEPSPTNPVVRVVRGLSRRVRTLLVAGALFLVLLVVSMTLPVPYVVLSPGETCDTLSTCENETVVSIIGGKPAKTDGALYLTTVNYSTDSLTVFNALSAWLQDDQVVVPRSALFPPGQSDAQVNQQNTADFATAQNSAIVASSCYLKDPKAFGITSVVQGGASQGKLRAGDQFVTVAGRPATNYTLLKSVLAGQKPGASGEVAVKRAGSATRTVSVKLGKPVQGAKGASLGITVNTGDCLSPNQVVLGLGDKIGGPSAGLMFALGILDKRGVDVTHGRVIAGTGTIDDDGTVGPIGGIQLKMIGARRTGATVFLAPAGNCADVRGAIPSGLQVIKVDTLAHAVTYLQDSAMNKSVPGC